MASLIPGYKYDIFISYRQKDNKGERWVSEFVEALKIELESTFKEEVSVYFDINPHDGLLETHEVDESLKEKLNCLIFIPIVSRTYCDPSSFAWEHEFRAFVEQASQDSFGLKIKLPSGNVASRVLPVRIHELESEDVNLCETLIDGVLRGVEFIYKEPGVNRPLTSGDDEKLNLNKTKYRNQLNKVANAIHEIIKGLKWQISLTSDDNGLKSDQIKRELPVRTKTIRITDILRFANRKYFPLVSILAVLVFSIFMIFKSNIIGSRERTLAIIPLRISNQDSILRSDGDYFIEALTNKLNLIRKIDVKPTISIMTFRNSDKTFDELREELGTAYLIFGNIRREGNNIKIWLELSDSRRDKLLWSETFFWEKNKVASITLELAEIIAERMNITLTQKDIERLMLEPSRFPEANRNYISANIIMRDAWTYFNYGHKMLDSVSFMSAIESYNKAIIGDTLFALAYAKRAQAITWGIHDKQLDSSYFEKFRNDIDKALKIDKDLPDIQIALGLYYYFCDIDLNKALFYFNNAARMEPGDYQPIYYQSLTYRKMGKWSESQELVNRVIEFHPQEALFLTNIGLSFDYLHNFDSAIIYHQKAINLVPEWPAAHVNKLHSIILRDGLTNEARLVLEEAVKKTGDTMIEERILQSMYDGNYEKALNEAINSNPADFTYPVLKSLYLGRIAHLMHKNEEMRAYFNSSLVDISDYLENDPTNPFIHGFAGLANSYLGNNSVAIEEGEKAIMLSVKNKTTESDMKINLAIIYLNTGEYEKSYSLIIYLLNNPSLLSGELLKLDPAYKPLFLMNDYNEIVKKIETIKIQTGSKIN